jgi:glycosyltransferase involved in cell wall biosynthesis
MTKVSAILCSRNPRLDYLDRVLQALENQTLSKNEWELIIVDSASSIPLKETLDLRLLSNVRFFREESSGYISARIRGIRESIGEILVFVDDDNVLSPNYLMEADRIGREFQMLGIWGGSVTAIYETLPPPWFFQYEYLISVRSIFRDSWTNMPTIEPPWIIGAGMVVRRQLALNYAINISADLKRLELDRNPTCIRGAEDIDLMLSVCDQGYGRGVFTSLYLTHLIPRNRCTLGYLSTIAKDNFASIEIIRHCRGERKPQVSQGLTSKVWKMFRNRRLPLPMRRIMAAEREGLLLADKIISQYFASASDKGNPKVKNY